MRAVRWGVLLLCGAGLLRDVSVHVWKEHPLRARRERLRPDTRYQWVPPLLPAGIDEVGFLTDAPKASEEGAGRLYDARYGLCPRVVTAADDAKFLVAEVGNPAALGSFARARGYSVVAAHGTVALLERQ
jgi:hypothetical protein